MKINILCAHVVNFYLITVKSLTLIAARTRVKPTPRQLHISLPKVALHMVTISPSFTNPLRAALPLGAKVSTKTFPLSSSFNTMPNGRRSSTRLSPAEADRDCFVNRRKSSSLSDMDNSVDDDEYVDGGGAILIG